MASVVGMPRIHLVIAGLALSWLVSMVALVLAVLFLPYDPPAMIPVWQPVMVADKSTQAARRELIDGLIESGLLVEIMSDPNRPIVVVDRAIWDDLEFRQKLTFADLWLAYCLQLPTGSTEYTASLSIRDSKTNHEIARFSNLGLKLE